MPYRHAHWYILALFPLIGLAFWPSYFARIGAATAEFHLHGATAALWLTLLIFQSWTIQHGARATHRSVGLLSLALFPLFLAGGAGIFLGMADRFAAGEPFQAMYAPRLAWLDFVGVGGMAYFFFQAMRFRRQVHRHSSYLLATVIFLLPPIFGRLSAIPLGVRGPEQFGRLESGFQAANLLVAAIAFTIAWRRRPNGRPFAEAGALTLLGALLFQTIGGMPAWEALYARIAEVPNAPFIAVAAVTGIAIAWAGWSAGARKPRPLAA